jgi:hypothetical protein
MDWLQGRYPFTLVGLTAGGYWEAYFFELFFGVLEDGVFFWVLQFGFVIDHFYHHVLAEVSILFSLKDSFRMVLLR